MSNHEDFYDGEANDEIVVEDENERYDDTTIGKCYRIEVPEDCDIDLEANQNEEEQPIQEVANDKNTSEDPDELQIVEEPTNEEEQVIKEQAKDEITVDTRTDQNQAKSKTQHVVDEEAQQPSENAPKKEFPKPFYCGWSQQLMTNPVVHPNGSSYEYDIAIQREPSTLYYPNRALQSIIEYEQQKRREQGTVMGSIRQLDASIRSNVQQLIDQKSTLSRTSSSSSLLNFQIFRPLPDGYYCPITQEIMYDPVIDPEGNTYECKSILEWLRRSPTSPLTRNPYNALTPPIPPPATTTRTTTSPETPTNEPSNGNINDNNHINTTTFADTATSGVNGSRSGPRFLYRNKALTDLLELEINKPDDVIHPTIRRWKEEVLTLQQQQHLATSRQPIVIPTSATIADGTNDTLNPASIANENRIRREAGKIFCLIIMVLILLSNFFPRGLLYLVIFSMFVIIFGLGHRVHRQ